MTEEGIIIKISRCGLCGILVIVVVLALSGCVSKNVPDSANERASQPVSQISAQANSTNNTVVNSGDSSDKNLYQNKATGLDLG
jgi:hypothetical protein